MKKFFVLMVALLLATMFCGSVLASPDPAPNSEDGIADGSGEAVSPGPAPNSGDGIPDGSGMDNESQNEESPGPAPNSGDGIPDGSGF